MVKSAGSPFHIFLVYETGRTALTHLFHKCYMGMGQPIESERYHYSFCGLYHAPQSFITQDSKILNMLQKRAHSLLRVAALKLVKKK